MKTFKEFTEAKIQGDLYNSFEKYIKPIQKDLESKGYTLDHYTKNKIGKDHAMRLRWDLLWKANDLNKNEFKDLMDQAYKIGNDTHIDTMLKSITGIK